MVEYGYSPVPGSAKLKTAPRGEDDEVAALEALDPSATAGRWVHGEWLCRVVVREGAVEVLEDVFDRLLPMHEAEEAAVYLQLYRLSYGQERNWCRTSRKVLRERANLSDRRLGGALAGLVEKEHVRLLHRDRRGTLYRVRLPHEIFGEPDHDRVFSARPAFKAEEGPGAKSARRFKATSSKTKAPKADKAASKGSQGKEAENRTGGNKRQAASERSANAPSPGSEMPMDHENNTLRKRYPKRGRRLTVGEVASVFLEQFPGRASSNAEVVEAVFLRMEENIELTEVAEELKRFGEQAPAHLKLPDLARWLQGA